MNNICKALYSRSNDITARSLDMIDIEEAMAENWGTTRGSDTFNTKIKLYTSSYGSTGTPSGNYVPNCYTTENIISQQNNDLRPGSSSATDYTQRSGFTCKCTYYNVISSDMSDAVGSLRATILETTKSWLASRCVGVLSDYASFDIRYLYSGYYLDCYGLFYSHNRSDTGSLGLSPLASLGSSVQLQKLDDNIWKVQ